MGDPEVIDHQDVSLLPSVEDEVFPDDVFDMCDGGIGDAGAVSKLCVHAQLVTPPGQEEEAEQPHDDGE